MSFFFHFYAGAQKFRKETLGNQADFSINLWFPAATHFVRNFSLTEL